MIAHNENPEEASEKINDFGATEILVFQGSVNNQPESIEGIKARLDLLSAYSREATTREIRVLVNDPRVDMGQVILYANSELGMNIDPEQELEAELISECAQKAVIGVIRDVQSGAVEMNNLEKIKGTVDGYIRNILTKIGSVFSKGSLKA